MRIGSPGMLAGREKPDLFSLYFAGLRYNFVNFIEKLIIT